jgi:hypothetical protein
MFVENLWQYKLERQFCERLFNAINTTILSFTADYTGVKVEKPV